MNQQTEFKDLAPERSWEIYTLSDSHSGSVRYLGVTTIGVKHRFAVHLSKARTGITHRDKWIRSILARGDRPVFSVIESGFGDQWKLRERYWISHMRNSGVMLTNLTDGGDGRVGYVRSPEDRARQSAAQMGNTRRLGMSHTPETRAKMGASQKGHSVSIETRTKISAASRGRKTKPCSPETRAKISAAKIGQKHSVAARQKMREMRVAWWKLKKARWQ